MENLPPVGPFFLLPLVWVIVCVVISRLGGWSQLAGAYQDALPVTPAPIRRWRMRSARMRWGTNYNGILNIGVDTQGLRLSVFFLFRPAHPPLFIPWHDIAVSPTKALFYKGYSLTFARAPGVKVTIRDDLFREVSTAAADHWPAGRRII